jgi:hypothetical protein
MLGRNRTESKSNLSILTARGRNASLVFRERSVRPANSRPALILQSTSVLRNCDFVVILL